MPAERTLVRSERERLCVAKFSSTQGFASDVRVSQISIRVPISVPISVPRGESGPASLFLVKVNFLHILC